MRSASSENAEMGYRKKRVVNRCFDGRFGDLRDVWIDIFDGCSEICDLRYEIYDL